MKLRERCHFQIDQFQGRPSPKNALAVASKNRRRFASRTICLPKSLEAARLLRTVRTSRLGRQSAASSGDAVSRLSLTVTSGGEGGDGTATDKASVSAILATCLGSQKHSGGSGWGSWSNVLRWARIRQARSWFRGSPLWCGARRDHVLVRWSDSDPIALDDGQFRGTLGTLGQGVSSPGIGVTTLGQFPTDIVHHSLDRLGRNPAGHPRFSSRPSPLERTRFRRRECHPLDQQGRQFAGIKPQRFPVGGERAGGRPSNNLAVPGLRRDRRSRSSCVS